MVLGWGQFLTRLCSFLVGGLGHSPHFPEPPVSQLPRRPEQWYRLDGKAPAQAGLVFLSHLRAVFCSCNASTFFSGREAASTRGSEVDRPAEEP